MQIIISVFKAVFYKYSLFFLHTMFCVSLMCRSMRSKRLAALATTFVVSSKASNNLDEVMEEIIIIVFGLCRGCMLKLALRKNHSKALS